MLHALNHYSCFNLLHSTFAEAAFCGCSTDLMVTSVFWQYFETLLFFHSAIYPADSLSGSGPFSPLCPDYYADLFRAPLYEVLPKPSPPLHVMESGGIPLIVKEYQLVLLLALVLLFNLQLAVLCHDEHIGVRAGAFSKMPNLLICE